MGENANLYEEAVNDQVTHKCVSCGYTKLGLICKIY